MRCVSPSSVESSRPRPNVVQRINLLLTFIRHNVCIRAAAGSRESGMRDGDNECDDMETLRQLLLGPLYEQNKQRDQKILEFVETFTTDLTTRLSIVESKLNELAFQLDGRDGAVSEIGEAIAGLGQQLRLVVSKSKSGNEMPSTREPLESAKA